MEILLQYVLYMIINKTCNKCGKQYDPNMPDPCLGRLPSVCCACCGHGKVPPYFLIWCDKGQTIANTSAFRIVVKGEGEEIQIIHEVVILDDNQYVDDILVYVPILDFDNYVKLLSNNKKESVERILIRCDFNKRSVEFRRRQDRHRPNMGTLLPLRELPNIFKNNEVIV